MVSHENCPFLLWSCMTSDCYACGPHNEGGESVLLGFAWIFLSLLHPVIKYYDPFLHLHDVVFFFLSKRVKRKTCFFTAYCPVRKSEAPSRHSILEIVVYKRMSQMVLTRNLPLTKHFSPYSKLRVSQFSFPISALGLVLILKNRFNPPKANPGIFLKKSKCRL